MKIAFWSEQEKVGTTFNMAAIACTAALVYPISIGALSSGYCDGDLEKNFQGKRQGNGGAIKGRGIQPGPKPGEFLVAAEQQEYFSGQGLDCLLGKEREGDLGEQLLRANMHPVIGDRLCCLPGSRRQEYKWWYKDRLFAQMHRIVAVMEQAFDAVFIDCGTRKDDFTQKILQEADLCVLNMDQEAELIGGYYRTPPKFRGKTFFLVGNYFKDELYNRANLQRLYRMDEDMLGAVPYNPQMQAASEAGMMDIGIRKYINHPMRGKNIDFEHEITRTAHLILKRAGVLE